MDRYNLLAGGLSPQSSSHIIPEQHVYIAGLLKMARNYQNNSNNIDGPERVVPVEDAAACIDDQCSALLKNNTVDSAKFCYFSLPSFSFT